MLSGVSVLGAVVGAAALTGVGAVLPEEAEASGFDPVAHLVRRTTYGMNPDQLAPGERAASTSNRNFEGRQGKGGRTHLVSPPVAAATAVTGRLSAPADL